MTFEEEFPSLKGLKVAGNIMNRKEIQENCLDKEKVREAFKELMKSIREEWYEEVEGKGYVPELETKAFEDNLNREEEIFKKELGLQNNAYACGWSAKHSNNKGETNERNNYSILWR